MRSFPLYYIHVRSLSNASRATALLFETACPLPLSPLSAFLPGVHREDFVTAGGQVVARSVRHHDRRRRRPRRREGEIHTKVDDFGRPNRLSPLSPNVNRVFQLGSSILL